MTRYQVHFTDSATKDAEAAYAWIAEDAPKAAVKWFNGLIDVAESLERLPARCNLAPESKKTKADIRQILYGRRPHIYRILFIVAHREVYVLHIRHAARQIMASDEIDLPPSKN